MGFSFPKYFFALDLDITMLSGSTKAVLGFPAIKGKSKMLNKVESARKNRLS